MQTSEDGTADRTTGLSLRHRSYAGLTPITSYDYWVPDRKWTCLSDQMPQYEYNKALRRRLLSCRLYPLCVQIWGCRDISNS